MRTVLLISNMYPAPGAASHGIFVKRCEQALEANGWTVNRAVLPGRQTRATRMFAYLRFFGSVCGQVLWGKYDLIYAHYITHSLLPIAVVRWAVRTPLVLHAHGTDLFSEAPQSRLIRRLVRKVVWAADMVIVPSEWFGAELLERYPEAEVFVSPSAGVDVDAYFPTGQASGNWKIFHIGFVSRLVENKGWQVLLRAVALLREREPELNLRVSFVGPGEDLDALMAATRTAGLESVVGYEGEFEGRDLGDWYRSFSVLVFPTLLPESLGLVGLEAMSCGTPVVASRIGGIVTYLRDGANGFLFEPGDAGQLADRLAALVHLPQAERETMRQTCIDTATAYRSVEVGQRLSDKLQALVNHPRPHGI